MLCRAEPKLERNMDGVYIAGVDGVARKIALATLSILALGVACFWEPEVGVLN